MNSEVDEFSRALAQLSGKKCWAIFGGPDTGRNLSLHLGKKVNNKNAPSEIEGAFILYIECRWAVGFATLSPLTSASFESNPIKAVANLKTCFHNAELGKVARFGTGKLNLRLDFINGLTLTIFAKKSMAKRDNFSLFTPKKIYIVGPDGRVRVEKR